MVALNTALHLALDAGGVGRMFDILMPLNFTREWMKDNDHLLYFARKLCVDGNNSTTLKSLLKPFVSFRNSRAN